MSRYSAFSSARIGAVQQAVYESPFGIGNDPEAALVAAVNMAKQSITMSVYSWSLKPLADAVIAASKRGAAIQIIWDRTESLAKTSVLQYLLANGVTGINIWGSEYILNHAKLLVVDQDIVCSGSYNYTSSAENSNNEILVVDYGIAVSRKLGPATIRSIQNWYNKGVPATPIPPPTPQPAA